MSTKTNPRRAALQVRRSLITLDVPGVEYVRLLQCAGRENGRPVGLTYCLDKRDHAAHSL
jgi:hypothetical protein